MRYLESCLSFAKDTSEWGGLDEYKLYTTSTGGQDWEESCDNAHDGYNVKWAFHLTKERITELADEVLADLIKAEFEQAIDENYDLQQLKSIINKAYKAT